MCSILTGLLHRIYCMVHCEYKPLLEIYQRVLNETMQIRDIAQLLNLATPSQE